MKKKLLRHFDNELQKQRRAVLKETGHDQAFRSITDNWEPELEEEAELERDAHLLGELDEQQEHRLRAINEGVVDHHLLGIHHVNETVPQSQWIYWDLGFLFWGAAMLVGGWFLLKTGEYETDLAPISRKRQPS